MKKSMLVSRYKRHIVSLFLYIYIYTYVWNERMLCRVLEILNVTHQPQQFSNSKFKTVINCSSDPDALGFWC